MKVMSGWTELHQIYNLKPQYFFLLADRTWKYRPEHLAQRKSLASIDS